MCFQALPDAEEDKDWPMNGVEEDTTRKATNVKR